MMMCIRRIRCGVMLMGMMRMTLCERRVVYIREGKRSGDDDTLGPSGMHTYLGTIGLHTELPRCW